MNAVRGLVILWGLVAGMASGVAAERAVPDREIWVRAPEGLPKWPRFERRFGAQVVSTSELVPGLMRVRIDRAADRSDFLSSLNRLPGIQYAEPNYAIRREKGWLEPLKETAAEIWEPGFLRPFAAMDFWNDPDLSRQWALTTEPGLHPDGAWSLTRGSRAVRVAIIDTGVTPLHPDLAGNLEPGYDVIDNTATMSDAHGHGTHVAGIIGAVGGNGVGITGVAGEVSLVPVRAVPLQGDESDADLIEAFEYAVRSGARVANCSFGKKESSQAVADVITAAGERGLLVVVAAGNDGFDLNVQSHYPASFHTPNMLVVASTDKRGAMAYTSNFGLGRVDVAAPGVKIYSTYNDLTYRYLSGTSMAAPQVTGIAALMLAVNPRLGFAELKQALMKSVVRTDELVGKVTAGGRVDATAAVRAAAVLAH